MLTPSFGGGTNMNLNPGNTYAWLGLFLGVEDPAIQVGIRIDSTDMVGSAEFGLYEASDPVMPRNSGAKLLSWTAALDAAGETGVNVTWPFTTPGLHAAWMIVRVPSTNTGTASITTVAPILVVDLSWTDNRYGMSTTGVIDPGTALPSTLPAGTATLAVAGSATAWGPGVGPMPRLYFGRQ